MSSVPSDIQEIPEEAENSSFWDVKGSTDLFIDHNTGNKNPDFPSDWAKHGVQTGGANIYLDADSIYANLHISYKNLRSDVIKATLNVPLTDSDEKYEEDDRLYDLLEERVYEAEAISRIYSIGIDTWLNSLRKRDEIPSNRTARIILEEEHFPVTQGWAVELFDATEDIAKGIDDLYDDTFNP